MSIKRYEIAKFYEFLLKYDSRKYIIYCMIYVYI